MLPSYLSQEKEPLMQVHKKPKKPRYGNSEDEDSGIYVRMVVITVVLCLIWVGACGTGDAIPELTVPESQLMNTPPRVYKIYDNTANEDKSLSIVTISDMHNLYRYSELIKIPPADILIFSGDALMEDDLEVEYFQLWLDNLAVKHKIVTFGNKDVLPGNTLSMTTMEHPLQRAFVLVDEIQEVMGYKVFGSPYTINTGGVFQLDNEAHAQKHWSRVLPPDADVDIIVTHGPPYGFGDLKRGSHKGDKALLKAVHNLKKKPMLWVCGHIHEGHGVYSVPHPQGDIMLINAAVASMQQGVDAARPRVVNLPGMLVQQPSEAEVLEQLGDRYTKWKGPFDEIYE